MITFFTSTKPFHGAVRDAQLNALRSWLRLHEDVQVIVFEKPAGIDLGAVDPRIDVVENVDCDLGVPRVDRMFSHASTHARNDLVCFVNSDIVLTDEFVQMAAKHGRGLAGERLLVGQRWDFDNVAGEWAFDDHWEARSLANVPKKLHAPAGSDWFLFPRGQYPPGRLPPLLIGRPGWDLCMIHEARRAGMHVVDASAASLVYHQNHDYSHKKVAYRSVHEEPEAQYNLRHLPEDGKFLFTLLACNEEVSPTGLVQPAWARGDEQTFAAVERVLGGSPWRVWLAAARRRYEARRRAAWRRRAGRGRAGLAAFIRRYHDLDDLRFDIGAGKLCADAAWISTDRDLLDITREDHWHEILGRHRVAKVMAEHVWEHLTADDARRAQRNAHAFLKPGGHLRLAVPDGRHPDPAYLERVRPGGTGPGADDHKVLYTVETLSQSLEAAGFVVRPLEYWDARGEFQFRDWSTADGKIVRSRRFDPRNAAGTLAYTSLIVDAIKP